MDVLLSLEDLSARTGQSVARLRRWCATGSLECERDGDAWGVRESGLPAVAALAAERGSIIVDDRAVALTVPRSLVPLDLRRRVADAMGLQVSEVSTRTLVVDDEEHVVAVWPRGVGIRNRPALERLADDLGGDLLDGDAGADSRI
jgi:hypothetical protein